MKYAKQAFLFIFSGFMINASFAQPVTGVWKGKIDGRKVELKIIKKGDSLTGTSYYYETPGNYRRYSIRGYFDDRDNSVVWWDETLLEERSGSRLLPGRKANTYKSVADFNCPGGTKMYLTGDAAITSQEDKVAGPVELQKFLDHIFNDEWDFVIDNYTAGANDPYLIDSVSRIAFSQKPQSPPIVAVSMPARPVSEPARERGADRQPVFIPERRSEPASQPVVQAKPPAPVKPAVVAVAPAPLSNQQKFALRSRRLMQEISISGDSIELNFYDNAEIDGDSIAIFLNGNLLAEHIRLTGSAYLVKLSLADLNETNELVMVAENLGTIPPNTSLMVVKVNGKRYEARLESDEGSSAVIRFIKDKINP